MAMSKQDFIALADAIREHNASCGWPFLAEQLAVLADFCQSQNPQFKRERWLGYINETNGPDGQTNVPGKRVMT